MHVVWDGGTEGTSISAACASKLLFAQEKLPLEERQAFVNLGRQPVQNFHSFASDNADPSSIRVDVQAQLTLVDPESLTVLPPLVVRVVTGQHDDLLVAAPELDTLGWNRTPRHFILDGCGLALVREQPAVRINVSKELDARGVSILRTRESVELLAHEARIVSVQREGRIEDEVKWLSLGIELPEGPV